MPKLGSTPLPANVENFNLGTGNFSFSGTRPDKLTAVEYTLATVAVDVTGSVIDFADQLLQALKTAVDACRKSPRVDNLLMRVVIFNSSIGVQEVHGFLPLNQIKTDDYQPFRPTGGTNLYDATYEAVESENTYAKLLGDSDFIVNGIVFVITDGDNNTGRMGVSQVRDALKQAVTGETMESMLSVLVGINVGDTHMKNALDAFAKDAGFSQFIDAGSATPGKLAKLAQFVSKSVSSQSQSLGSGGPSKPLTF